MQKGIYRSLPDNYWWRWHNRQGLRRWAGKIRQMWKSECSTRSSLCNDALVFFSPARNMQISNHATKKNDNTQKMQRIKMQSTKVKRCKAQKSKDAKFKTLRIAPTPLFDIQTWTNTAQSRLDIERLPSSIFTGSLIIIKLSLSIIIP